ncbi:MAG: hypothetical protein FWE70_01840 [Oscillospiraceae bacterium]|nr:hypothetical protein [Oscillospiraceae bacterium]
MEAAAIIPCLLALNLIINLSYKEFGVRSGGGAASAPAFMALWTGVLAAALTAVSLASGLGLPPGGGPAPRGATVAVAACGGLAFALAGVLYIHILTIGPFTWSALMMQLSSFVTVIYSVLVLGEAASVPQAAGMAAIAAMIVVMGLKGKGAGPPFSSRWLALATLMLLANGGIFSAQKTYHHMAGGEATLGFLTLQFAFTSAFAAAICMIMWLRARRPGKAGGKGGGAVLAAGSLVVGHAPSSADVSHAPITADAGLADSTQPTRPNRPIPTRPRPLIPARLRAYIPPALTLAASIGLSNALGMRLMDHVTAAVQYPLVAGGGVVLAAIAGMVRYRERPGWRYALSAALLILGVTLFGLG